MPALDSHAVAAWCGGQWDPAPPAHIEGVSNDTRTLKPGCLYVALTGERLDGHAFVGDAFDRGAAAALVNASCGLSATPGRPLLRVKDSLRALQELAAAYRRQIGLQVIAVTGSVGKSTVKELTSQILATSLPVAATRGNWNNHIGLPLSLLAVEPGARLGVFELGMNHAGEIAALCDILQPDWGIVTSIGPVHIEFFESVQGIAHEKAELLRHLPPDGVSFFSQDTDWAALLRDAAPGRCVTVAAEGNADYVRCPAAAGRAAVLENATGERFEFQPHQPGDHSVVNAMLAIAVARTRGVAWDAIRHGIESYKALPMRWERSRVAGFDVINDAYNANPLSMRAAIRTLAGDAGSTGRWLVLGGMLELGDLERQEHLELGAFLATLPWTGLVTVGNPGALIAQGARDAGMDGARIHPCANAADAAGVLARQAARGDRILFKASRGMKLETVIEALRKREEA